MTTSEFAPDPLPLREELLRHGNNHSSSTHAWEALADGTGWHQPTPSDCWLASARTVSVIIPAHQVGYCLPTVLDALDAQHHQYEFEVIVVDHASTDDTAPGAARHRVVDRLVRLPQRMGAATARNVGTALAIRQTVLYLDGDMVIPPHVITDIATRATDTSVLVGFHHNLRYEVHSQDPAILGRIPNLAADHRVVWRPPPNTTLPYSGITLPEPLDGRPLDDTHDFIDLGYGQSYYDWDLPRMVVTALVAVPRAAVLDVGGFYPEFGRLGWGMEDTYVGACLIAAGLLIIPLRQAVGFHLDPPDAAEQWQHKLAGWPRTLARYRNLLALPDRVSGAACSTRVGGIPGCHRDADGRGRRRLVRGPQAGPSGPTASVSAVITDPPYSSSGLHRSDRTGRPRTKYHQNKLVERPDEHAPPTAA